MPTRWVGAALALAGGLAAAGGLAGVSIVPLWVVALVAIQRVCALKFGDALALAGAVGGWLTVELLTMHASSALGLQLPLLDIVVWSAVVAAAAIVLMLRRGTTRAVWSPRRWLLAGAAASGGLILWAAFGLAQVLPGAHRIGWAMNGDAANAIAFVRVMIADNGLGSGSAGQSTPLPFLMTAAQSSLGRHDLVAGARLEHDIVALALVWLLLITVCCVLAGVIAARATRTLSTRWAVLVTVGGSVAGLSWYAIGVQFQFGFINTAYATALLLAAWLAFDASENNPWIGMTVLLVCAIATLSVWGPLVVCIGALVLLSLILTLRSRPELSVRSLLPPIVAGVGFVAYVALVTVPQYLSLSALIGGDGGFPDIGPASVMVITAATLVFAALGATYAGLRRSALGAGMVIAAMAAVLVVLLVQRRAAAELWGYYPAKFAWSVSLLLLVIAVAFAIQLVAVSRRGRARVVLGAVTASLFIALYWSPAVVVSPLAQAVPASMLVGDPIGLDNRGAETVFALTASDELHMLWRSAQGDPAVNHWLLQSDFSEGNAIRTYAHARETLTTEQVCEIAEIAENRVVVHTADAAASADLAELCPAADLTVLQDGY